MNETLYIRSHRDPSLELIYNDVWLPGIYSRRILCFELPLDSSHEKAVEVLKRGLQSIVSGTPELGGMIEVVPPEDGRKVPWRAIRPYRGLELIVRDLRDSFQTFAELEAKGFPVAAFKDGILMPVPVTIQPEPNPETKVQLNLIEGGMLLSFCAHHSLTDGNGMNAIMAALGEECKHAADTSEPLAPRRLDTDRALMAGVTGSKTSLDDHPAYGFREGAWLPHAPSADTDAEQGKGEQVLVAAPAKSVVEVRSYRITGPRAEALKEAAGSIRISTHDAITAIMWRTMILARYKAGRLSEDQISTFTVPHNGRKHIGLDKHWVGNCIYFIAASLPAITLIADDSLPVIATSIRKALNAVDGDVVGGLMEMRKKQVYDLTWEPFFAIDEPTTLASLSFYHSELYDTDWGHAFGRVKHFTSSDEGGAGGFRMAMSVGAKLPDGKGCDVELGLDAEEEGFLKSDALWNEYFEELGAWSKWQREM